MNELFLCDITTGMQFVKYAGFNEWAESNRIIILYPQTTKSDFVPYNPKGCWDWWGYTGLDYATKFAPQLVTVQNIVSSFGEG
jgi:poly(3-hydroxybutyrate) depolymerase